MICDHCGKEKDDVEMRADPFIRDVYPEDENEESWWCDECYDNRCDDI